MDCRELDLDAMSCLFSGQSPSAAVGDSNILRQFRNEKIEIGRKRCWELCFSEGFRHCSAKGNEPIYRIRVVQVGKSL